ncbi:MAG: hypothetical protein AB1486_22925 [Planctomycetota bacterium]
MGTILDADNIRLLSGSVDRDRSGVCAIEVGLEPGSYRVLARASSQALAEATVVFARGGDKEVAIELRERP